MRSKLFALSLLPAAALAAALAVPKSSPGEAGAESGYCARDPQALLCTLTGETLSECCCETKAGALICGKTGEVLPECCCVGTTKAASRSRE